MVKRRHSGLAASGGGGLSCGKVRLQFAVQYRFEKDARGKHTRVCQGRPNRQAGKRLSLSPFPVDNRVHKRERALPCLLRMGAPVFCAFRRKTVFPVFRSREKGAAVLRIKLRETFYVTVGMQTMRKTINEAGKKAIETFVRENLSGRVNEETV